MAFKEKNLVISRNSAYLVKKSAYKVKFLLFIKAFFKKMAYKVKTQLIWQRNSAYLLKTQLIL